MRSYRVIAHRGGAAHAPENTVAAFERAAEQGVSWVETDVCLLGDGTPILFHDATFERCTGAQGRVRESDWAYAATLSPAIPRLDEALAAISALGLGLNLELKCHGDESDALVDAVLPAVDVFYRDHPAGLLVSSFAIGALERLRERRPDWPRGLICRAIPEHWRRLAADLDLVSIHPDYRSLTRDQVDAIHAAGYAIYPYTPNTRAAITRLRNWGVEGVITDDPLCAGMD